MTLNMLIGILEQGLIYGIMAMGLLITYRILDFPDLTVDSSFPLGAAVSATLTLQGVAPWLTLLIGCAAGDNPSVVTTLSRDQGTVKILGLIIANALVALAGAVMCQQQRFFDISMGTGTMVAGLASVIIGTNLFRHASFLRTTTMVLIGSILYKACVSIAISFGLDAQDMKLITAVLFLAILVLSNTRKKKVRIHA